VRAAALERDRDEPAGDVRQLLLGASPARAAADASRDAGECHSSTNDRLHIEPARSAAVPWRPMRAGPPVAPAAAQLAINDEIEQRRLVGIARVSGRASRRICRSAVRASRQTCIGQVAPATIAAGHVDDTAAASARDRPAERPALV